MDQCVLVECPIKFDEAVDVPGPAHRGLGQILGWNGVQHGTQTVGEERLHLSPPLDVEALPLRQGWNGGDDAITHDTSGSRVLFDDIVRGKRRHVAPPFVGVHGVSTDAHAAPGQATVTPHPFRKQKVRHARCNTDVPHQAPAMLNGEVVKHPRVLGREGEIGDGTPPLEQPRTDAVTNPSRKRVHHHIRRVLIHQCGGGRSVDRHHVWSAFGQSRCIRVDRGHVMAVSGQRVGDPSADQSSTEHEDAGHVLQMRPRLFILMFAQRIRLQKVWSSGELKATGQGFVA